LNNFTDCSQCVHRWGSCSNKLDEECLLHNLELIMPTARQAYKDGYEQGQNFQREVFAENCKRCSKKRIELSKEIEALTDLLNRSNLRLAEEQIKNEELKKSVTEKNSEIEELKEELKNYAKVINELMGIRLDDTEEVGRLIEIAQYRNWSEL